MSILRNSEPIIMKESGNAKRQLAALEAMRGTLPAAAERQREADIRAVRAGIAVNGLTERHARALLRLSDEREQLEALDKAVKHQMNVRSLERLIERMIREKAAHPQVRGVYRDHRMFVNAMMNTVRTLQESGAGVTSKVVDRGDGVEITVLIPRAGK